MAQVSAVTSDAASTVLMAVYSRAGHRARRATCRICPRCSNAVPWSAPKGTCSNASGAGTFRPGRSSPRWSWTTRKWSPNSTCTREELSEFAAAALALGVRYLGVCCGAAPHHIRAVAEAAGKAPPASRYSPDMSKHSFLGTAPGIASSYQDYASQL